MAIIQYHSLNSMHGMYIVMKISTYRDTVLYISKITYILKFPHLQLVMAGHLPYVVLTVTPGSDDEHRLPAHQIALGADERGEEQCPATRLHLTDAWLNFPLLLWVGGVKAEAGMEAQHHWLDGGSVRREEHVYT